MRPIQVQVRDLYKAFTRGAEEIRVLQELSLSVPEGEFLALMGPSGSGKTTLLNLIAGLDTPTGGDIWVGEEHVSAMSESQLARWRTRNVGFIFQFYYLLPVLTAYENVELPLLLLPMTREQRRKQVLTALDLVNLRDRMDHRPSMLSGGQQQRVGIARAMVTDPALIVADEPTGDLDTRSADEVLNIMQILCTQLNKTIIMVTHDPHAAERAARVLHLEKGKLVLDDNRTAELGKRQGAGVS
jgi:putative ABC transport system ATP-binding protein